MNIIEAELNYSEVMVESLRKSIRSNFFTQCFSFSLLIVLILVFNNKSWLNGFSIGFNLINLMYLVFLNVLHKEDLKFHKVKVELYTDLKKACHEIDRRKE